MVMTLTVASELNTSNPWGHDNDRYFLSQGKTIESANKNMYKYLCKEYDLFEYISENKDIMSFLLSKFARWQNGKDTWTDEESWSNQFSDFTFPRNNKAEIVEISEEMYEAIIEEVA